MMTQIGIQTAAPPLQTPPRSYLDHPDVHLEDECNCTECYYARKERRKAEGIPVDAHIHKLGWHLDDLSDFKFFLVILGEPVVLKNHKQIITLPGRRPLLVSGAKAEKYLRSAAQQLNTQWSEIFRSAIPIDVQLNACIRTYLETHRKTDASNLYESPQDALKSCGPTCKCGCIRHAGIIADDYQIASHDGSRRLYDKDRPRVEIVLSPYRGDA